MISLGHRDNKGQSQHKNLRSCISHTRDLSIRPIEGCFLLSYLIVKIRYLLSLPTPATSLTIKNVELIFNTVCIMLQNGSWTLINYQRYTVKRHDDRSPRS